MPSWEALLARSGWSAKPTLTSPIDQMKRHAGAYDCYADEAWVIGLTRELGQVLDRVVAFAAI